ncbi:MAG TPA: ribonuclease H-like domain-containing protein [Bacteroidota bacterium]|nr:ribonuclease H-like domain-containing protein [Bacteroidota bacterium]
MITSMLEHTFCHLPGISVRSERSLWAAGITHWDDAEGDHDGFVDERIRPALHEHLAHSRRAMSSGDMRYFAESLPQTELWRLYGPFREKAVYLDIETTGMGRGTDHITTIVVYDGLDLRQFIHGRNLEQFPKYLRTVELLVTFNGRSFDLPFIQRQFGESFAPVHLDLRYILKSVGIQGGLKNCEHQLGLDRGTLEGVDGYMAVLLWREYRRSKNARALETLLAYNSLDVLNLEPLMITAHNRKLRGLPFGDELSLDMPRWQPSSPFEPDAELVGRLRTRDAYERPW